MPLYLYQCPHCEYQDEYLLKVKDEDPVCPMCDSDMEKQISSGTSFSLKGGGWFKDGYTSPHSKQK